MWPQLLKIQFCCVLDEVFRNQDQGTTASSRTVSAADVVLYGVNIVLPLMSQDLLKVKLHISCQCSSSNWICYADVFFELVPISLFSSSPLCVTSITSSSPSSVRSFQKRSHSYLRTSSKASCSPWSWEWPRILPLLCVRQCVHLCGIGLWLCRFT